MTAPSIALQRRVVTERARSINVPLVTPDSPSALREAASLIVSATSERTYAEVREGVSFYTPRIVGRALSILPSAVTGVLEVAGFNVTATGLVLLSERAWNERPASTWAHERSHEIRDAEVSAGGVVSSVAWAVGYLAHPVVRAWEEGTCRVNDLVGLVVFEGWPIDDALTAAKAGAALYRLDDTGREVYLAALDSAADSLRAGQFPGVDTEVHHIARMLRREGADLGRWNEAVGE